jgi:hypothetical protein
MTLMRKFAVVAAFVLAFGVFASAQMEQPLFEIPKTEVALGYAYQYASLAGFTAGTSGFVTESTTSLNGFALEFSHYLPHNKLGFTIDISHDSKSNLLGTGDQYSRSTYLAGATYRVHRYGFLSTSVHALAGVDHGTFTVPNPPNGPGISLSFGNTEFAALAGGTLDGNLSRHIAIRLVQADYLYTNHYSTSQSSFRYSGGVVLRF